MTREGTARLAPELRAIVEAYDARSVPLVELTAREARDQAAAVAASAQRGPELFSVEDVEIPDGERAIIARRYRPAASEPPGTVVYFHSGGWVLGSLDVADPLVRRLAHASSCEYISVAYRLAPEDRFPAAVDDAVAAVRWAAAIGRPLIVHGDSAGGNLAAAATLVAREQGEPSIALQVLVYPVTDHDFSRPSYRLHADGGLLKGDDMKWFWDHYTAPDQRADPRASPIRSGSLAGLPPAFVIIAEVDPLRDEGLAYALALDTGGVAVELCHYEDACHGFLALGSGVPQAREAVERIGQAVRRALFNTADSLDCPVSNE